MHHPYTKTNANTSWHSSSLNVMFAGSSQTVPAHKMGPQVLDYYLLHYVLRGQGSFQSGSQNNTLGTGEAFLIFPGETVTYESDIHHPWEYKWVAFIGSEVEQLLSLTTLSRRQPVGTPKDAEQVIQGLTEIQQELGVETMHSQLTIGAMIRWILAAFTTLHPTSPVLKKNIESSRLIEKAVRWILLQYTRPEITIDQLAKDLGYHRTYLSQIFKEHTGLSPKEYLIQTRLDKAKELLQQHDLPIQQVAYSVGYMDPLYFSKQFKAATGFTPVAFKNHYS